MILQQCATVSGGSLPIQPTVREQLRKLLSCNSTPTNSQRTSIFVGGNINNCQISRKLIDTEYVATLCSEEFLVLATIIDDLSITIQLLRYHLIVY